MPGIRAGGQKESYMEALLPVLMDSFGYVVKIATNIGGANLS
ncbi:hypothetical protein [Rhodococcus maanshanensis]|uniref:Uncharacterized protein n=1 Tax=Rhodococcus maanshanensis TaxID=183556 RepID=A0A1H7RBP2_9NOCA|nr:hypothetical protein [Rhodococcus maanshanensis]SEL57539.1 hypothetical protein SAMN05444583_11128 [Rhodococcus maanshanensis]